MRNHDTIYINHEQATLYCISSLHDIELRGKDKKWQEAENLFLQEEQKSALRHFLVSHSWVSSAGPKVRSTHVFPPAKGRGFVHVLERLWVPLSQLTLHGPQEDQSV